MKQQRCCGEIYLEQKELKKAIEVYTNALKYYSDKYEIYYNLGICYSRINDFDIARKCFQKTVELNDDMYLAYYRLGQIALLYRDFDSAEENFSKSWKLKKRRPDGAPLDLYDIAAPILSFAKNTGRTSLPVSDFVTRW